MESTNSSSEGNKYLETLIISLFISVPLGSSVLSAFHLYTFLNLGNLPQYSIASAIIYEICSIATLYAIVILSRLNPFFVWASFGIVTFLQFVGNVYYSFDFIQNQMNTNSKHIINFSKMLNFLYTMKQPDDISMVLALIIGLPVPMLSIFLTKSLTEYLRKSKEKKEKKSDEKKESEIKLEKKETATEQKGPAAAKIVEKTVEETRKPSLQWENINTFYILQDIKIYYDDEPVLVAGSQYLIVDSFDKHKFFRAIFTGWNESFERGYFRMAPHQIGDPMSGFLPEDFDWTGYNIAIKRLPDFIKTFEKPDQITTNATTDDSHLEKKEEGVTVWSEKTFTSEKSKLTDIQNQEAVSKFAKQVKEFLEEDQKSQEQKEEKLITVKYESENTGSEGPNLDNAVVDLKENIDNKILAEISETANSLTEEKPEDEEIKETVDPVIDNEENLEDDEDEEEESTTRPKLSEEEKKKRRRERSKRYRDNKKLKEKAEKQQETILVEKEIKPEEGIKSETRSDDLLSKGFKMDI